MGLFNHYFSVTFQLKQLTRLRKASQGLKTIKAFVHELKSLFIIAGVISAREKVLTLWYELNLSI